MRGTAVIVCLLVTGFTSSAIAACPQELAVYRAETGDALEFMGNSDAELKFHQIALLLKDGPQLDAYVEANFETGVPEMQIQYNCPDGDLTFDDLKECTIYKSAVHAIGDDEAQEELPIAGAPAAQTIMLPKFADSIWQHAAFDDNGPTVKPAERFELSGCLE